MHSTLSFPVHHCKLLSGSMAEVKMLSGWHSQSKSGWPLAIVQKHHCEPRSWIFWLCRSPQREDNHLLSKNPAFSNKSRGMRGTDGELWQRVTNESSQSTNLLPEGSRGKNNLHHPRQSKQHEKNLWWYKRRWCIGNVFHSFSLGTSFTGHGHKLLAA